MNSLNSKIFNHHHHHFSNRTPLLNIDLPLWPPLLPHWSGLRPPSPCDPQKVVCPSRRWPFYALFATWSPFKNFLAPTTICYPAYCYISLRTLLAISVAFLRLQIFSLLIWPSKETPSISRSILIRPILREHVSVPCVITSNTSQ